jgi:hypothetical protein
VQLIAALAGLGVAAWFRVGQLLVFPSQVGFGYDFAAYWRAALRIGEGQSVYLAEQIAGPYPTQQPELYLYPPFLAALLQPFMAAVQDFESSAFIWALAGLAIVVAIAVAISRSERLSLRATVVTVTVALALPAVGIELFMGNVHLLLVGLCGAAWLFLRRHDVRGDVLVGFLVASAALVKVFPAFLIVWLWATGRRRAATISVVAVPVLIGVTLPATGLSDWLAYPRVLLNVNPPTDLRSVVAPSAWLGGLVGPTVATVAVAAAAVVLIIWSARRQPAGLSFAAAVLLSLAAAPGASSHYLVLATLPLILAIGTAGWQPALVVSYLALFAATQLMVWTPGDLSRLAATLAFLTLLAAVLMGDVRRRANALSPAS